MTALRVIACGPMTTLQDAGRRGYERYGVSTSGAMDGLALAAANALVRNPPGGGAVELMLLGGRFRAEGGPVRLVLAGAAGAADVDGRTVGPYRSFLLRPGETLTVGPSPEGVYAYLAAAGGFDVPPDLGSVSLHPRAGIGGIGGRPLRAGDPIPLREGTDPAAGELSLPAEAARLLDRGASAPLRVVPGPQDDHFTEEGLAAFLAGEYRVAQEADRMGYRLEGPAVPHRGDYNIVSDGIVTGSVQVPGNGQPIVLMADRQTTGGYPKIATVITPDLRLLAQRRSGAPVRFKAVGMEEAQAAARERAALLASLPRLAVPARRDPPGAEELLALTLAGAAVDAIGEPG